MLFDAVALTYKTIENPAEVSALLVFVLSYLTKLA